MVQYTNRNLNCVIQQKLKDNNIQTLFHEYGEIKELILTSILTHIPTEILQI